VQTQDRIGQHFGNYRLVRFIGQGGFAEVYLAEHIHLKKQCAIKVLTATNLGDAQRDEFLEEARTVADLQQDHIIQIFDFGVQVDTNNPSNAGIPYFVMEYALGGTLRKLHPPDIPVPLDRIMLYVNQISEALQYAHDHNPAVIHCDVKPENMLLRNPDYVLLSDFGIALTGQTGLLLKPAQLFGTATYVAPERWKGAPRRASDQYSLAINVYEWLCGHPPFDGNNQEVCVKHLTIEPEELYPTYPYITQEIDAVVQRALAKVPQDRYPRVQDFAQALEQAIQKALRQQAQQSLATAGTSSTGTVTQIQQPSVSSSQQTGQLPGATPQTPTGPLPTSTPQQQAALSQLPSIQPIVPSFQPQQGGPFPNRFEIEQMFTAPPAQTPQAPAQPAIKPPVPATLIRSSRSLTHNIFELSSQFASDRRNSVFRNLGVALNILSALVMFLLLKTVPIALLGLLISWGLFELCIRVVDEKAAIFFGAIVALYWGAVGWVLYTNILSSLNLTGFLPPVVVAILFFGGSLGLHIWYVSRKI
jgi:serine/threonine protein kinase